MKRFLEVVAWSGRIGKEGDEVEISFQPARRQMSSSRCFLSFSSSRDRSIISLAHDLTSRNSFKSFST